MRRLLLLALTLTVGIAAGLAATLAFLAGQPPFGTVRSGAWSAWPDAGTSAADPYARALFAREARLALPTVVGLRFFARTDDGGGPLEGRCDYSLGGQVPVAQYWTLTVLPAAEAPRADANLRSGLTSAELIRDADGNVAITLAQRARPGNWLPLRGEGPFRLMLSLYDTPLGMALLSGSPIPSLPTLARGQCR